MLLLAPNEWLCDRSSELLSLSWRVTADKRADRPLCEFRRCTADGLVSLNGAEDADEFVVVVTVGGAADGVVVVVVVILVLVVVLPTSPDTTPFPHNVCDDDDDASGISVTSAASTPATDVVTVVVVVVDGADPALIMLVAPPLLLLVLSGRTAVSMSLPLCVGEDAQTVLLVVMGGRGSEERDFRHKNPRYRRTLQPKRP